MITQWLDYDKVNKFLFNIYLKTRGQDIGFLRKTLVGNDWLITDGYIGFRVPDDKLIFRPSLFANADAKIARVLDDSFTVNPVSQKLHWTPKCLMKNGDNKVRRFYVAEDKSFAVLVGEELFNRVNNLDILVPYATGQISAVQLAEQYNGKVHAIIVPCRFDENDVAAILPDKRGIVI